MLRGLFQVSRLPSQGVLRHRDFAVPRLQVDREVHRLNQLQDSEMGVGLGSNGHELAGIEWISLPIWEIRQWGIEWNWQCVDRDIAWYQISPYLTLSHHISPYRVISSDLEWLKDTQGVSRVDDLDLDIFRFDLRYFGRIDVRNFKDRPQRCQELLAAGAALTVKACEPVAWPQRSLEEITPDRWSSVITGDHRIKQFPSISCRGFPQVSHAWNKSIVSFNHIFI